MAQAVNNHSNGNGNKTSVVLTEKAQQIKDEWAWLGLKYILSAGLELLAKQDAGEICEMVKRIKQEESRERKGKG